MGLESSYAQRQQGLRLNLLLLCKQVVRCSKPLRSTKSSGECDHRVGPPGDHGGGHSHDWDCRGSFATRATLDR